MAGPFCRYVIVQEALCSEASGKESCGFPLYSLCDFSVILRCGSSHLNVRACDGHRFTMSRILEVGAPLGFTHGRLAGSNTSRSSR